MTMFGAAWGLSLVGIGPLQKLVAIRLGDGCDVDGSGKTDLADLIEWCGTSQSELVQALNALASSGVTWRRLDDGRIQYQLPEASQPKRNASSVPDTSRSFIYVVRGRIGIKVGITKSVAQRLDNLRVATLDDSITLVWSVTVPTRSVRKVERRAHEILASKLLRNEWFAAEEAQAIAAVQAALKENGLQ